MATNKNARLRYEALDKCFSNFSRKFYIEDLQKACYNYLTEQLSIETTVSKRQVYSDIEEMKTSPNMAAPIEAYQDGQRKYYRYSSPGFSIVDLTDGELIELESTINMLTSFRGMYKRQNKLFHFHKTFCSEFDIINTKQNVHFNKVVSPIYQFCLSLHQFSIGAKAPFINKRD